MDFNYYLTIDEIVKMISEEVYDTLYDCVKHGYNLPDLSDLTSEDERDCIEMNACYLANKLTPFHAVYVDKVYYDYDNLIDLLCANVDMNYVREKLKEETK